MNDFKRIRELQVVNIQKVSLNMKRITFFSEDFFDFSMREKGAYFKFIFLNSKSLKKTNLVRPYTIRHFRKERLEVDVDFAIHNKNSGIASRWASIAKVGDKIKVSGPGARQEIKKNADWYFFIGDMSALPAITSNLEELEANSKGIVILEILSKMDKIEIDKPDNIKVYWLINNVSYKKYDSKLLEKVSNIKWLPGMPFIWVACEFTKMKKLRDHFKFKKKINKENIYISSYWRIGSDQEQHKSIKKKDSLDWGNFKKKL